MTFFGYSSSARARFNRRQRRKQRGSFQEAGKAAVRITLFRGRPKGFADGKYRRDGMSAEVSEMRAHGNGRWTETPSFRYSGARRSYLHALISMLFLPSSLRPSRLCGEQFLLRGTGLTASAHFWYSFKRMVEFPRVYFLIVLARIVLTKSGILIPAFLASFLRKSYLTVSLPCHIKSSRLTCLIATCV